MASTNKANRRQHWLAQFYQRQFAEPMFSAKICVFEFAKRRWEVDRTPYGIGWEKDHLSVYVDTGNRTDQADQFLRDIVENPAAPAMQRLAVNAPLEIEERAHVARFIATTIARCPNMIQAVMQDARRDAPPDALAALETEAKKWRKKVGLPSKADAVTEFIKPNYLQDMWTWIKSFSERILHWEWNIFEAKPDQPFVTSDYPVFARHFVEDHPAEVTFPVSSRVGLFFIAGGTLNPNIDTSNVVEEINKRTLERAREFVIARHPGFPGDAVLRNKRAVEL